MSNEKVLIDFNSFFEMNDFFQQKIISCDTSNGNDFFSGYIAAQVLLSPDKTFIEPLIKKVD